MSKLTIKREIDIPSFGLWKWKDADYRVPLVVPLLGAKVFIFLHKPRFSLEPDLEVFVEGHIEIEYDPAPQSLIDGLKKKNGDADTIKKIFESYKEAINRLEAILLSSANQKYLSWIRIIPEREFFGEGDLRGRSVEWTLDDGKYVAFTPKVSHRQKRHPMFLSNQLITIKKWRRMQDAANNQELPLDELFELYRIRNKAYLKETRAAVIEASIISETLLRDYGLKALELQGFSRNKIKKIRDELTFNNLLNIVLPLSLNKKEVKRISQCIQDVDGLRRLRNDIVHGNIQASDVDYQDVIKGVEASIRLVNFLKQKIENASK